MGHILHGLAGLAIFAALVMAGFLADRLVQRMITARGIAPELSRLLGRAAKITLIALGTVCALGTWGIDVTALVAGLGLTGFALGLALKDIISNALSGILLIVYKPFGSDDRIAVSGFEGLVVDINLRYTVLNAEGKQVFVPNSTLFNNAVTVFARASEEKDEKEDEGSEDEAGDSK